MEDIWFHSQYLIKACCCNKIVPFNDLIYGTLFNQVGDIEDSKVDGSGEENRAKVINRIKQELPVMIDGIDMTKALQNVGGDSELLRNVLIKFYETHLNDIKTIRKSYAEGDMEVIHRIAHTLKGIAATLGASNLLASSEGLDGHVKSQQTELLPELINSVDVALIPILESIKLKLIEADD